MADKAGVTTQTLSQDACFPLGAHVHVSVCFTDLTTSKEAKAKGRVTCLVNEQPLCECLVPMKDCVPQVRQ